MSITEQLHRYIEDEKVKKKINSSSYATLTFKVKDGKVIRFEITDSINLDELGIEITD